MQEIKLTRGKVALVDDEDLQRCNSYGPWYYNQGYACTKVGSRVVLLHRFILNAKETEEVDHRSGETLNNQKENLRLTDRTGNQQNKSKREGCSSKYKGVSWATREQMWRAHITINEGRVHLGYFDDEEKAAQAYDTAAIKHFEVPRLNFPAKVICPQTTLFDSCNDATVFTIEVDNKMITDLQILRNSKGEDLRKTILAFMDFYSDQESLNIILLGDVLEKRQSYVRFTNQLANFLTHGQTGFTQCRVQFDNLTSRLGIFCRKGTEKSSLNSTFLGSVTAALRVYGSAQVDMADIPLSYVGNKAALKHQLTKRIGKVPRIVWDHESVKIYAEGV